MNYATYIGPYQISMLEIFCKNSQQLLAISYFHIIALSLQKKMYHIKPYQDISRHIKHYHPQETADLVILQKFALDYVY